MTVRTQLKKEFPNWKRLPKKMKREISNKVMNEVTADYDFNQEITTPVAELLGIENQLPAEGIIPLEEMTQYIDEVNSDRIIKLSNYDRSSIYIKDEELQFIDCISQSTITSSTAFELVVVSARRKQEAEPPKYGIKTSKTR